MIGMIRPEWTGKCVSSHSGVWAMEPRQLSTLAGLAFSGRLQAEPITPNADDGLLYVVREDGLAVMSIVGPMQKFDSKFGGTNTTRVRRAARSAMADDRVRAVLLMVDSPGGSADGTLELAQDIAALARAKPTATNVSGMMASAALWVGVQASRVTAGPADLIGSIGTYAVIQDLTGAYEQDGVRVEVIAAGGADDGGVKGAGVDGIPVTDEYRAEVRKIVSGLNELFMAGVADGRGMPLEKVRGLADGRVHLGPEALRLGLVDAIETPEQAAAAVLGMAAKKGRGTKTARARLELDRA